MTAISVRDTAVAAPETPQELVRRRRRRSGDQAGPFAYVVLVLAALLFLAPFYYMVVAASRPMAEMNRVPPPWTPGDRLWENVRAAMQTQDIGLAVLNSTIVSGTITVVTVLLCTVAGYAFAKLRFRGNRQLFAIAVGTMMIPPTLGVVPLYQVMAALDLTGRLSAVILPSLVTAFGVFFMRQYLVQSLPDELVEAARVDGASALRTVWSIVLPIARPGMAVLALLTFMAAWNDFFWPVIALNSSNPTVQVALNNLGSGYVPDQSIILAGTLVGTLPLFVVFLVLGRQIVSGIMNGAVKG